MKVHILPTQRKKKWEKNNSQMDLYLEEPRFKVTCKARYSL